MSLHVAALVFVPGCAFAAWWQIGRAADGNDLSYLYSVMWPVFGIMAIVFWWSLIHTDYDTVGLKGMRRQTEHAGPAPPLQQDGPPAVSDDDDPELAAYNARLADLASRGTKTWRRPEPTVVRRPN